MPSDNATAISLDNTMMPTAPSGDDAISTLLWKATILVIHEVTLQHLLCCSNDTLTRILWEQLVVQTVTYIFVATLVFSWSHGY